MEQITEKIVLEQSENAFAQNQFQAYYQPQYNVSTGMLVGVEALARWIHPEYGVIPPIRFIPVFEKNGIISRLDLYVFEQVCIFLKKCVDDGIHIVPVSVNLSRGDLETDDYIDRMCAIQERYDLPSKYIRVEITESIAALSLEKAQSLVRKLHQCGFLVELDDFGSGYSSLSILKDINYDIIKLDMNFLTDDMSGRGGTIVSSIVRMAKWLNTPVIAEGVETRRQAEYMKSIGCTYLQGYLYSKPVPEAEYLKMLSSSSIGLMNAGLETKDALNPANFWNYDTLETLMFNSYVGAAVVFRYASSDDSMECLRVNRKYLRELGMNMTESDLMHGDFLASLNENSTAAFKKTLKLAISTQEEQECEVHRTIHSECCGDEEVYLRYNVQVIGIAKDECVFYATVRNITDEKKRYRELSGYEEKFKNITEQANIYYWEYTVATKEMRPCFRCMRDLGLPPLVTNYPEPAIEAGIFPADYADMYRDWHKQIAAGAEHLEAVIPLTVGRVPFHVRYTTEFDELGRPVKAYGSATLVTPEEKA